MTEYAFTTPQWLLEEIILRNIEHAGAIERVQNLQGRHLRSVMSADRMNRLIEDEAFRGEEAYTLSAMLEDLSNGVWSELANNESIDPYRRNLQRTYLQQFHNMMESSSPDVDLSDIKPMLRDELRILAGQVEDSLSNNPDRITQVHLRDVQNRIDDILDDD